MSFEGSPEEIAERLNELPDGWANADPAQPNGTEPVYDVTVADVHAFDGWANAAGVRFVRASRDEVVAESTIEARHLQPYGIVHGGVYCTIVETLASTGAALDAMRHGLSVVGLDNHTSFVRATGPGKVTATARPITRGPGSWWGLAALGPAATIAKLTLWWPSSTRRRPSVPASPS